MSETRTFRPNSPPSRGSETTLAPFRCTGWPRLSLGALQEALASRLPLDILVAVFRELDLASLGAAARVCKIWRGAAQHEAVWAARCAALLAQWLSVTDVLGRRVAEAKGRFGGASKERLEFLASTVRLLRAYAREQVDHAYWRSTSDFWFAARLLCAVNAQLAQTGEMLRRLEGGLFSMTVNFDIFELALRRYYEEASHMLPLRCALPAAPEHAALGDEAPEKEDPRLAVIESKEARELWLRRIGPRCYCDFDAFYRRVVVEGFCPPEAAPMTATTDAQGPGSPRFRRYLAHFLNFPRDDLMTAYRFHALVSLFGPLSEVALNFETYALGSGFMGLANMIKAEEVLRKLRPTVNTVAIRFSRQKPTCLAFTAFDAAARSLEHRRNCDANGRTIPIATFLKDYYPGYALAEIRVDDLATRADSTLIYASSGDVYLSLSRS